MNGGLPIWFYVSDRQIAVLRTWCLRALIVCAGGIVLNDLIRDVWGTPVLIVTGIPPLVVVIVVGMIVPTIRLRLFWVLPPITVALLAAVWRYASWIILDAAALLYFGIILVTNLALLTWALMAMPELGKYKGLHYMSPDWVKAKD